VYIVVKMNDTGKTIVMYGSVDDMIGA